jgi:hypothetical protein
LPEIHQTKKLNIKIFIKVLGQEFLLWEQAWERGWVPLLSVLVWGERSSVPVWARE